MSDTITIDPRFCGPRQSGNGGYVSGRLAAFIDGPARASLKSPPPLGAELRVERDGARVAAFHGETLIGTAAPAEVAVDLPAPPDPAALAAARAAYLEYEQSHYLPYCFVCGPRREAGDGLRIFAGPAGASPVNADAWTPHERLAREDGLIAPEYLWAALDCPSAFALRLPENRICLLGSLAAEIRRRTKPGERLIAMAWAKGADGRKHYSDSALVDENGEAVAIANALWIELNDLGFVEKLREENV